jgi:hypothetical protein
MAMGGEEPIVYSGEWWHSQTDAQITEILRGSFLTSPAFIGAVAERDRRDATKRQKADRLIAFWGLIFAFIAAVTGIIALFK